MQAYINRLSDLLNPCFFLYLSIFTCLPLCSLAKSPIPAEDDLVQVLPYSRATVRFKLPAQFTDYEFQSFLFDTTLYFYGDDYEISLKQSGTIFHKNANVNFESRLIAAGCGNGRAYNSTELAEMVIGGGLQLNQAPIKVCHYNACLTTVHESDQGEKTFSFSLSHPFFEFNGKGPLSMKHELIRSLHSFAVYAWDAELTKPSDRKVSQAAIRIGEKIYEEGIRTPIAMGVIKKAKARAEEDIQAEDAPSGTIYNMEVFEPDPEAAQPAIVQVKEDWHRFLEDEVDGTAEISLVVGEEEFGIDELFYVEPGQEITAKIAMKGNEEAKEVKIKMPAEEGVHKYTELNPSIDRKENISYFKPFTITTGTCACAGTQYFDINTINQEPIDTILLDAQFKKLNKRCEQTTTDFDERQARRAYMDMLADQVRMMKQLINNLIKQTETSLAKLGRKIQDIEKGLEEYEKEYAMTKALTGSKAEKNLDALSWEIRKKNIDLKGAKNSYDKFLALDNQINAALRKGGLPINATKKDIDQKIAEIKAERAETLDAKIVEGIKHQIRQLEERLEQIPKDSTEIRDLMRYRRKNPNEGWKELGVLQEEMKEKKASLEKYKKTMREYEEKLTFYETLIKDLEAIKKPLDHREIYRSTAESYKKHFVEIKNMQDQYAEKFFEKYSADAYLKVLDTLKLAAEEELERTVKDTANLDSALQIFKRYVPKVKAYETDLTYLYGTLALKPTFGNLTQEYRSKQSTKALKSAIRHMVKYGSHEFWDFRDSDVLNISKSFVKGYVNGLNPFETLEFFEYTAYLVILQMVDEKLAHEEMQKVLHMGAGQIEGFFKMERFADQLLVIAGIAGNAKGELAMAKAVGKGVGVAAKKLDDLDHAVNDAYARYKLRQWPMENKNTMVDKLFSRTKKVDIELWEYSRQWMDKKIDKEVSSKEVEFSASQGERLKELITPLDLYYLSKPDLAPQSH